MEKNRSEEMIDFTACQVNKFKGCDGANGNKINVLYDRYKLYAEVSAGTNEKKSDELYQ